MPDGRRDGRRRRRAASAGRGQQSREAHQVVREHRRVHVRRTVSQLRPCRPAPRPPPRSQVGRDQRRKVRMLVEPRRGPNRGAPPPGSVKRYRKPTRWRHRKLAPRGCIVDGLLVEPASARGTQPAGLSTPCPWCRSPSIQEALWARGGQPHVDLGPSNARSRRSLRKRGRGGGVEHPGASCSTSTSWSTAISEAPAGHRRVLVERSQQRRRGCRRGPGVDRPRTRVDAVEMRPVDDPPVPAAVLVVFRTTSLPWWTRTLPPLATTCTRSPINCHGTE